MHHHPNFKPESTDRARLVDWVFRHSGGCLIEQPDLLATSPPPGRPWRWAATVWSDPICDDGWNAFVWSDGERGWQLAATLTVGDIIEFGIVFYDDHDQPLEKCTVRWIGWLQRTTAHAVILRGPYPHPADAELDATTVIDEVRLNTLLDTGTGTGVSPLSPLGPSVDEWDDIDDEP